MRSPIAMAGALVCLFASAGCLSSAHPRTSYEAHSGALRLPQYVVFQDSTGPLSYHTPTGKNAHRQRVTGKACQRGIAVPLLFVSGSLSAGWGEGAYQQALDDARQKVPTAAGLYDVRADMQTRSILLVYRERCLHLDAAVLMPVATATATTKGVPAL